MKKLAYYTCYFGGNFNYSKLIPPIPSLQYDCYYFTNNKQILNELNDINTQIHNKWIIIFVENIPEYDDWVLSSMSTKELRSCPHHYELLQKYEYICWFDSKLKVFEEVIIKYMDKLENSDKIWALTKHPYSDNYNTVWDEYHNAITCPKYGFQKEMYKKYIENKIQNGYSEYINIFYCSGFTLKKMCEKTKEINEFWYKEIQECGIECQISFQFVQQKYGDLFFTLDYQESWKYFYE
jgi:hypothetical protein